MTNNTELNEIFSEENTKVKKKEEDGMRVDIVNTANGVSARFTVYEENTMRDIINICQDLSLSSEDAPHCVFECNGKTTSDLEMTCEDIGLVNGGKLLINPSGKVA